MKHIFTILFLGLLSFNVSAQKKGAETEDNVAELTNEKCNCNGRQFQEKSSEKLPDDKYLSEYQLDFKVDSGGENIEYVNNLMREKLKVLLAKKIRSKITSVETHSVSENSVDKAVSTSEAFSSVAKSESNVDLSGTGFKICPDKKQDYVFHGVIYINRAQFLSSQLALYKIGLKELETQINIVSKNSMDYTPMELSKEYSNCIKKKDKIDQIAIVYSSVSTKNEITDDPMIQKTNENIIPKLVALRKRVYNKDVDKKVDSAKTLLEAKKFPEAMTLVQQVLKVNPENETAKELQAKCTKTWGEEANYKIDDYLRNNKYEEALDFINKTLNYKINVVLMNEKLTSISSLFFNDFASKIQAKIDAKDVANAKKLLKKLQPYSNINQAKFDQLSASVKKLDW